MSVLASFLKMRFGMRLLWACVLGFLTQGTWAFEPALLKADQAFQIEVVERQAEHFQLRWRIADGYYLYRNQFAVSAQPSGEALALQLPSGHIKEDATFGRVEVYYKEVSMRVATTPETTQWRVTWQGCADVGVCYPPQTQIIELPAAGQATQTTPSDENKWLANLSEANESDLAQLLREQSLAWTLPLFFALGLLLAFTPCMLPMLPLISGLVVGREAKPRRALALSLTFVVAMAITYAAMGVAAAMAGANLQSLLQSRAMTWSMGIGYVLFALAMFGVFIMQLPSGLRDRLDALSRRQSGGAPLSAVVLGVLSALLVGPCMTAPLAGALLYIAQDGRAAQGALVLFSLGMGMGLPLIVMSLLGSRALPKPGPWMDWVRVGLGFALLATAIWMLERTESSTLVTLLWAIWLIGASLSLWQALPNTAPHVSAWGVMARTLALIMGLCGSVWVVSLATNQVEPWCTMRLTPSAAQATEPALAFETVTSAADLEARLAAAAQAGRPTMVEFTAQWYVTCRAIEKQVFTQPAVQAAMQNLELLRVDVTDQQAWQQSWMRTHQVMGPPTMMFFDAQGQEQREARLVGMFDAPTWLARHAALTTPNIP